MYLGGNDILVGHDMNVLVREVVLNCLTKMTYVFIRTSPSSNPALTRVLSIGAITGQPVKNSGVSSGLRGSPFQIRC